MEPLSLTNFLPDFAAVPDPRLDRRKHYPLLEILLLCVAAGVSGYQMWEVIADFGRLKPAWLRQYLPYANGIPSHDTVNRVMGLLDLRQLERCLVQWSTRSVVLPGGTHLVDGMRLRRSVTAQQAQTARTQGGRTPVALLHAWCNEAGLCLGQAIRNRRPAERGARAGRPVGLTRCGEHRCGVYAAVDGGSPGPGWADYVLALKRSHLPLYTAAQTAFAQAPPAAYWEESAEKPRHARHETRRCRVLPAYGLPEALWTPCPQVRAVVEVRTAHTPTRPLPHRRLAGEPVVQTCYYLASLSDPAATLLQLVCRHWGIENRLHWVQDGVLGGDQNRKRAGHAAANYAAIRKLVLRLLQRLPDKISLQRKQNSAPSATTIATTASNF